MSVRRRYHTKRCCTNLCHAVYKLSRLFSGNNDRWNIYRERFGCYSSRSRTCRICRERDSMNCPSPHIGLCLSIWHNREIQAAHTERSTRAWHLRPFIHLHRPCVNCWITVKMCAVSKIIMRIYGGGGRREEHQYSERRS